MRRYARVHVRTPVVERLLLDDAELGWEDRVSSSLSLERDVPLLVVIASAFRVVPLDEAYVGHFRKLAGAKNTRVPRTALVSLLKDRVSHLHELRLADQRLDDADIVPLLWCLRADTPGEFPQQLTRIDLSGNRLSDVCTSEMALTLQQPAGRVLDRLCVLNLSSNALSSVGVSALLAALPRSLTELDLSYNLLDDALVVPALCAYVRESSQALKCLRLRACELTGLSSPDGRPNALGQSIGMCVSLRTLDLAGNPLAADVLFYVFSLLSHVDVLDVSAPRNTENLAHAAQALPPLLTCEAQCPTHLNLSDWAPLSLPPLCEALLEPGCRLRSLDVSGAVFSSKRASRLLDAVAQCASLAAVDLSGHAWVERGCWDALVGLVRGASATLVVVALVDCDLELAHARALVEACSARRLVIDVSGHDSIGPEPGIVRSGPPNGMPPKCGLARYEDDDATNQDACFLDIH